MIGQVVDFDCGILEFCQVVLDWIDQFVLEEVVVRVDFDVMVDVVGMFVLVFICVFKVIIGKMLYQYVVVFRFKKV